MKINFLKRKFCKKKIVNHIINSVIDKKSYMFGQTIDIFGDE
jgi:hypothetical protein